MSTPTPDQLQALLAFAAAKLGTTPEALRQTVQNTNFDQAQVEQLLKSPKAKALIEEWLA